MKITSLSDALRFFTPARVNERDSSGDSSARRDPDRRERREERGDERNEAPATAEELRSALEDFAGDEATRSAGLRAEEVAAGPSGRSRVRLLDREGSVLREIDSREFVRLRLDARVDPRGATTAPKRGKILDQKL